MTDMFSSLTLPNGTTLPNRLCKAAMEEKMCGAGQLPSEGLFKLYRHWANGGAGLILSGNVMVAPDALTGPGGVVLTKDTMTDPEAVKLFERWAEIGRSGDGQFWLQISHPGRQVYAAQGMSVISASATKVTLPGLEKMFVTARALDKSEIEGLITRFADTAEAAQTLGYDGVQIHAAHGYLAAQFLSPLTNLREDKWGGNLENRARFILEIIKAVRARVGSKFGVGVKLNSADFQKGGFDAKDAAQVVTWMNDLGVDFVEISGGSYESPAMQGFSQDGRSESTKARELYFLGFAEQISNAANMPIMVTGGVTQKDTAEAALAGGKVDIVGMARAMAYVPDLPNQWQAGHALKVSWRQASFKKRILTALGNMALTKNSLHLMAAGKAPKLNASPLLSIIKDRLRIRRLTKRYKIWLAGL